MKNKLKHISIYIMLLASMVYGATNKEFKYIDDSQLPSIDSRDLNKIISETQYKPDEDLIFNDVKSAKKIDHSNTRKMYSFDTILREINNIYKKRKKIFDSIYLSKDSNLKIYLTKKEYFRILGSSDIDDFLFIVNNILNTNFSYRTVNYNKKIYYIGNYLDKALDNEKNTKYILLTSKNKEVLDKEDMAFEYFKNYKEEKNKAQSFNLDSIETLNLYIKLLKWNINISPYENVLLRMFKEKTQYLKNFYFIYAYNDLKNNPSIKVAQDIKDSLLNIYKTNNSNISSKQTDSFYINSPLKFSKLLSKVSSIEEGNYILSKFSINPIVKIDVDRNLPIKSFYELNKHNIKNLQTFSIYGIKIISNKYIKNATKEVVLYEKKVDTLNQAKHYLNQAVKVVVQRGDKNFSQKLFINEINEIKKDISK